MKEIQLTQGKVTRVDDADFAALNMFNWSAERSRHTFYAVRKTPRSEGYKTVRMHQQIAGGKGFDHEDGDGLNNQRYNLRPANKRQNAANTAKQFGTTSQYRGVDRSQSGWRAQITADGKRIHLGRFALDQEISAAKAYDTAAILHHGKFARLNFPIDNVAGL